MKNNRMGGFISEKKAIEWAEKFLKSNQNFKVVVSGSAFSVVWTGQCINISKYLKEE